MSAALTECLILASSLPISKKDFSWMSDLWLVLIEVILVTSCFVFFWKGIIPCFQSFVLFFHVFANCNSRLRPRSTLHMEPTMLGKWQMILFPFCLLPTLCVRDFSTSMWRCHLLRLSQLRQGCIQVKLTPISSVPRGKRTKLWKWACSSILIWI